jgi:hypothetical protein
MTCTAGIGSQVQFDRPGTAPLSLGAQQTALFQFVGLIGFYFFILLILILKKRLTFLEDPDVYWHVAVGRMIWQTKSFPHFDELSYTFKGHAWIAKEWLGQLFFFGGYTLAGWRGVALLAASVVALTYALLCLILSRSMRVTVALGISVGAFVFSLSHFNARPQIFADPIFIIWFASLVRAVEGKRSPSPILFPLMTLWANVHASFTFGLAIAGLLAAEAIFDSPSKERFEIAKRWVIFLALATGAACLTPYGFLPMLAPFKVFVGNEALQYTTEWQPTILVAKNLNGAILLVLLFAALHRGVKLPFWRLSAFMFVLYMMLEHLRFASLFAIVAPILLATPLIKQFPLLRLSTQIDTDPAFFERMARVSKRWLYSACSLIGASVIAFGACGPTMAPSAEITPEGAVDYIYEHQLTGNIYNPLNFGGYLIFRGVKTFIDGRTDQLFLENFMNSLFQLVYGKPTEFVPFLQRYDVALAVVIPHSIEAQELERSADWQRVYGDSVSQLFQRRSSVNGSINGK